MSCRNSAGGATPPAHRWAGGRARLACLLIGTVLGAATASAQQSQLGAQAPGTPHAMLEGAWSANAAGNHAEVIDSVSRLLQSEEPTPVRAEALLLRALARYRRDELGEAADDLRSALLASPTLQTALELDYRSGTGLATTSAAANWPGDFAAWCRVTIAEAAAAVSIDLPDVSLEDLDLGSEVLEVAAHFVVDIEIVRIPVIVLDFDGSFMSGLEADSFRVREGTALPQAVTYMISERDATSVGILVDSSSGMAEYEVEARFAVSRLIETLAAEDEIFLIQFADEAKFLSPSSLDRGLLAAAMQNYTVGGGRALYDAIALGLIQMRDATFDKKALIVLSLGDDAGSDTAEADVRLAAQREGVSIHGIVLRNGAPRWRPGAAEEAAAADGDAAARAPTTFLQQLVHHTGGLVALRPQVEDRFGGLGGWLRGASTDITDYVNNQYLILHESPDPPQRGQWKQLAVEVGPLHERVRSRSGYVR